jgi:bifunctional DNA-binding transcriptional regulator/antitoxin component of YhaV-PrlF toxin-antitoxin module
MGEITNLYRGFQTVVPSKIRKKLNLDLDYILEWTISENNKVEVEFRKKTDFLDLVAMVSNENQVESSQ